MRKSRKTRIFLLPIILCAAVALLLSVGGCSRESGIPTPAEVIKSLRFKPYGEGYEITEYSGSFAELEIPSVYKGKPVLRIDDGVFAENYRLETVLIPESVIEIGANAFSSCCSLERLHIYGGAVIGDSSFEGCFNLSKVNMGSVARIGNAAFKGCADLRAVELPHTLTRIEDSAFEYCLDLTEVNFPDSLTYIGAYAFRNCDLKSVQLGSGTLEVGDFAFSSNDITQLDLGGAVRLGDSAFYYMQLKKLILPDTLKSIGNGTFSACKVQDLHIGGGLDEFDYDVFSGFSEVEKITVSPDNTRLTVNDGVLFSADMTRLLLYPTLDERKTYTVPDNVAEIGDSAFSSALNLTSVSMPESLRLINDYAFLGCHGIEEMIIPEGVSEIGVQSISFCGSLTHLQLPESLRIIRKDAFFYNSSLTEIDLPGGIEFLGETCFSGCPITEFHIGAGVREMEGNPFSGTPARKITVSPENKHFRVIDRSLCTADGKELIMYPRYIKSETYMIPHSVEIIGGRAFAFCDNLQNVIMHDGIKSIGDYAFYQCSLLDGIIIPEGIESIGEYAFAYCNTLQNLTLPRGDYSIGKQAFSYCSELKEIVILEGCKSIGAYAFAECSQLESIVIHEGTESIEFNAFSSCRSIKSIALPASITEITSGNYLSRNNITVICPKDSYAWQYCEKNNIPHSEE